METKDKQNTLHIGSDVELEESRRADVLHFINFVGSWRTEGGPGI